MSLINWLSQKSAAKSPAAPADDVPTVQAQAGEPDSRPLGRRAERVERREQLYAVVRHAMSSAGVLSSSYKFKVLSLDSRGASFLVMMDMVSHAAEDPQRMAEIESLIAHNAKNRFEIVVAAVYWRLSDYVAAGLTNRQSQASRAVPEESFSPVPPVPQVQVARRVDPINADEVLAFKNAFSAQGKGAPLFASGEIQKSGKRSATPSKQPDFADGHEADERASPLGPTQYGDLN
jgi:hypothetical protein